MVHKCLHVGNLQSSITVTFTPPTSSYIYVIINDPAPQDYVLTSVTRSDSKNVALGVNTWRTHRIQ